MTVTESFERAWEMGDDTTEYLAMVKSLCRFADVIHLDDARVDRFEISRKMAMLDLLSSLKKKDIAEYLGMRSNAAGRIRKTDMYVAVRDRLVEVMKDLARPKTMGEAAEQFEQVLMHETLGMALHGTGRDKLKAGDEFTGRLSAKKGRDAGHVVITLPPGFVEQIRAAQQIVAKALPSGVIDVSAEEVRVPDYEEPEVRGGHAGEAEVSGPAGSPVVGEEEAPDQGKG